MKYVVYEIWTRSRIIEAEDEADAYIKGEPESPRENMNFSNWHIVPLDEAQPGHVGGLNYRQVTEK